jgi:hypothetical protein
MLTGRVLRGLGLVWLGTAVLLLAPPGGTQSGSENCPYQTGKLNLPPGTYQGSFSHRSVAKGGEKLMNMALTTTLSGTFTVEVGQGGKIERVTGQQNYSCGGQGSPVPIVIAGITSKASGPVSLGDQTADSITLLADGAGGGSVFAIAPGVRGGTAAAGSGRITLKLKLEAGICGRASGTFSSPELDRQYAGFSQGGFAVEQGPMTWSLGANGKNDQELQEFEQKVRDTLGYQSTIAGRGLARRKLLELLSEAKKKHGNDQLMECLSATWMAGAHQMLTAWIQEDLAGLARNAGDAAGLEVMVRRILGADRQIALLGLDTCSPGLHESIWTGLESAFVEALQRAYKERRLLDLLRLMRDGSLLGVISPKLEEKVWGRVQDIARADAKRALAVLKSKPRKRGPCNPELDAAIQDALYLERQANLLGVEVNDAKNYVEDLPAATVKEIQDCLRGKGAPGGKS